jgi:hypothetical protein
MNGNQEDAALQKNARCHVTSDKFKKIYEVLEGLRHPRWQPWLPKALAFLVSLALSAPSLKLLLNLTIEWNHGGTQFIHQRTSLM